MDVNLLLAWGWNDHVAHQPVARWIQSVAANREDVLMTASISEIGFVRVSIQLSKGQVNPNEASRVLNQLINSLGDSHEFLNDDLHGRQWPKWCQGASQTTDAHLSLLARKHNATLATLDSKIPGALLIS
jgi:uncharacterized protein